MPESCHPTLGGASDRLNGFQMGRKCGLWKFCNSRWPGSVLAGPARARLAHRQERGPGVGGMLITERGEHVWQRERMENTCPISHLFTFDCQAPARLKEEEAGGGRQRQRWNPFKVHIFDEDANSLIVFQTFRRGERKPWRDWNSGLSGAAVHWQRGMCADEGKWYWLTAVQDRKTSTHCTCYNSDAWTEIPHKWTDAFPVKRIQLCRLELFLYFF